MCGAVPQMLSLPDELTVDEGLVDHAYKDSLGVWTGGVGHNLESHRFTPAAIQRLRPPGSITRNMAIDWLVEDIRSTRLALYGTFPWVVSLDPVRLQVLENMAFQMGLSRLGKFKDTLNHIRIGAYKTASSNMLNSEWAKQTPGRAQRMARRMATGEY